MTRPSPSSTDPVDCTYRGASLTKTPVAAATASASWPTGNSKPCLAMVCHVVASSSTDNATTRMSGSASWWPSWSARGERAQLGVAVRAPAAAVQQHDAEVAGERVGQVQRLAVGGGDR